MYILFSFRSVADGDILEFGQLIFTVHFTPGHTVGHVIYTLDGNAFGAPTSVFSGDHLFLGGTGKNEPTLQSTLTLSGLTLHCHLYPLQARELLSQFLTCSG